MSFPPYHKLVGELAALSPTSSFEGAGARTTEAKRAVYNTSLFEDLKQTKAYTRTGQSSLANAGGTRDVEYDARRGVLKSFEVCEFVVSV